MCLARRLRKSCSARACVIGTCRCAAELVAATRRCAGPADDSRLLNFNARCQAVDQVERAPGVCAGGHEIQARNSSTSRSQTALTRLRMAGTGQVRSSRPSIHTGTSSSGRTLSISRRPRTVAAGSSSPSAASTSAANAVDQLDHDGVAQAARRRGRLRSSTDRRRRRAGRSPCGAAWPAAVRRSR